MRRPRCKHWIGPNRCSPVRPGQIERHTHDHNRNGTARLSSGPEVDAAWFVPHIEKRHRSREFTAFTNQPLRIYPKGELRVILDNVITHRSKEAQTWHSRPDHQRVAFRFIPTYSSWLNLIDVLCNPVRAKVMRSGHSRRNRHWCRSRWSTSTSSTTKERSSSGRSH